MVKWKIHSHQKNISWNQCFTNLFTITLLSRMFCKKSVIGNFLNFHTVDYDTFCLDLEISKEFWLIIVFHHCRICLITDSLCTFYNILFCTVWKLRKFDKNFVNAFFMLKKLLKSFGEREFLVFQHCVLQPHWVFVNLIKDSNQNTEKL